MNKSAVEQAIARLESQALHWEGYHMRGTEKPIADARLVRRFINAERQELLILRRYVGLAANVLEEVPRTPSFAISPSLIEELRERAKPKREKRK